MSKQDRQGARTPADLEYRYAFGQSFAEVMGIAEDARRTAAEAKKVSASVRETTDGLSLKVNEIDGNASGEVVLVIKKDTDGTKYSQLRAGVDEIRFDAGDIVIESDNFKLHKNGSAEFSGELKSPIGTFGGWTIDAFGIHQTSGVYGAYEVTTTTTGTDLQTRQYTGYLFYWLSEWGLYRVIFDRDRFYPYDPADAMRFADESVLWSGDMLNNNTVKKLTNTVTPM